MSYCDNYARGQCNARDKLAEARRFQADLRKLYCARCFCKLVDPDYFPEFVGQLVAVWREFNEIYQRYLDEKNGIAAFAILLSLIEDPRFRCIQMPNGEVVELRLEGAKWDFQIERNPKTVLAPPRRCTCKRDGRREAIEQFMEPMRRRAS